MLDIIGVGSVNMDLLVQMDEINLGYKAPMGDFSLQGGGLVASAMCCASRLGAKVGMVGTVGDSRFGQVCLADLADDGIDVSHMIVRKGARDAFGIILADKSTMERTIFGRKGTVEPVKFEELDKDFLKQTKSIFISAVDDLSIKSAAFAHENGIKVGYDADGNRADDGIFDLMKNIDYFIASEVWYEGHCDQSRSFEENLRELKAIGPEIVIVTLGVKGSVGIDKDGTYFELPAFRVPVIDTTGAGDIFHGAFMFCQAQGWSAKDSARFSSAVSAIKCTRLGGRAALPTFENVEQFLSTGTVDSVDYTDIDKRVELFRSRSF